METVKLRNGTEVLAKSYKGELSAVTYANRTQAEKRAAALGAGWSVCQFGRPFYVGKVPMHKVWVNGATMVSGPGHLTAEKSAQFVATYRKINPDLPADAIYAENTYR